LDTKTLQEKLMERDVYRWLKNWKNEKNAPFGIRFSLHPLSFTDSVLSIPLYAIEALPGLVKQIK